MATKASWWGLADRRSRAGIPRRGSCRARGLLRQRNMLTCEILEHRALLAVNVFQVDGTWRRGPSAPGAISGSLSVDTSTGRVTALNVLRTGGIQEGTGTTVSTGGVPRLIGGTPLPDTTYGTSSIVSQGVVGGQYRIQTSVLGRYQMVVRWDLPTGSLGTYAGGPITFEFTTGIQFATVNSGSGTLTLQAPANRGPTDIIPTPDPMRVAENSVVGTTVGTLATVDPDGGNTHTYTLVPGVGSTDNASFQIVGNTLRTNAVFDFESKSSYAVRIRTTDQGGLWYEESFTVGVTNVNEAPKDIRLSYGRIAENSPVGTLIGFLSTSDPDPIMAPSMVGVTFGFTYTLVSGVGSTDNASFQIVGDTLRTNTVFDFESKSSYRVRIRTTDRGGLWYEESFSVGVTDVNEAPVITSPAVVSVPENQTGVVTVTATDPDADATLTYSLVGGADQSRFTIDPRTGVLAFLAAPDFEGPTDVGSDNVYDVTVQVSDGELTARQAIVVTVTDVADDPGLPPDFLPGVDDPLRRDAWAAYGDRKIDRTEMIKLLRDAGKDGVTKKEVADLRRIIGGRKGSAWEITMDDPVRSLARKVVGPYADAVSWSLPADGTTALEMMNTLVGKWFFGQQRPATKTSQNPTEANTEQALGSLFVDSVSRTDVRQGRLSDCYFLAALTGVADSVPQSIRDMFIDNGDGTWTVGFFNPDPQMSWTTRDYVTVDRHLPVTEAGSPVFAGFGKRFDDASGNELWVALAEKAYAQWAETGAVKASTGKEGNSYAAIEWGYANHAVYHLTGAWPSVTGDTKQGLPATARQQLDEALNNGHMVMLGTKGGTDSSGQPLQGPEFPYTAAHVYFAPSGGAGEYRLFNPQDNVTRDTIVSWDFVEKNFNTLVVTGIRTRNVNGREVKEFFTLDKKFAGWKTGNPTGGADADAGITPSPQPADPAKPVAPQQPAPPLQPSVPVPPAPPAQVGPVDPKPLPGPLQPAPAPVSPAPKPALPGTSPTNPVAAPPKPAPVPTKPVPLPPKPAPVPVPPTATPPKPAPAPAPTPAKPVTPQPVARPTMPVAPPAAKPVPVPVRVPVAAKQAVPPVVVAPIRPVR